jgi:threonine dehydrogenase-like Zn-dependent dehydrogenase
VTLHAKWEPKPGFKLGAKDIDGKQTYLGSQVWRNPKLSIDQHPIPEPADDEVLIELKAVGICGSDIHMNQATADGYIFYPGLTGFPAILGHEIAGVVVKGGKKAFDKRTMKPFKGGEPVCAEEMVWCAKCRPCADGLPNHCEKLDEIGFNVNGGFARYIVVPARLVWSLEPLRRAYKGDDIFLAGSLVEPTSVAYTAMIQWGGGVKPGDAVVICGGGPIGLAACRIMKTQGASTVIISEPEPARANLGKSMGADHIIDPTKENFAERVLALTDGMGAKLYLEATGLPTIVYPAIEQAIWEGRTLNSTVVVVARAEAKMPVTGEVLQVRMARIVGTQGHSGHGNFPRVIQSMANGMDMRPLITKEVSLEKVPDHIVQLRTDKKETKVTCMMK